MSIIISCFFIFLLCLSNQSSCKARHIIEAHQKGSVEKVDELMEMTKGPSGSVEVTNNKGENHYIMTSDDDNEEAAGSTTTTTTTTDQGKMMMSSMNWIKEKLQKHIIRGRISGGVLKKHSALVVYVSWRVPSKNQAKKNHSDRNHSGFFSDYSRPRTRPPSHN
ncbi:hypothetical protein CsatB_009117 [Cannabis sativa]